MERETILLAEYSEAGQSCRAHEGYVRTTLNMHLTIAVAVSAFLVSSTLSIIVQTYICFGMAAFSLCMVLLVLRHREIYAGFAERARDIEAELCMKLYNEVKLKTSGEPNAKKLSAFIIGLVGIFYLIAAFIIACKL